MHPHPDGAFPALAADAGAGNSSDHGGFRCSEVVAVQARDGEGLDDVKFETDSFEFVGHGWISFNFSFVSCS